MTEVRRVPAPRPPAPLSASERAAIVSLLDDEDPKVTGVLERKLVEVGNADFEEILGAARDRFEETPPPVLSAIRRRSLASFVDLAATAEGAPDLEAALSCLSLWGRPDLAPSLGGPEIGRVLDDHAAAVRRLVGEDPSAAVRLAAVRRRLFETGGEGVPPLAGDALDYENPDNSYLASVLTRGRGIPVSLCSIVLLVARRVGLPLVPIGAPGHFLLAFDGPDGRRYLDAFGGGTLLTADEALELLGPLSRAPDPFPEVDDREILARTIRNLRRHFLGRGRRSEVVDLEEMANALL